MGPDAFEAEKELKRDWERLEHDEVVLGRMWGNLVKIAKYDCLWIVFWLSFCFSSATCPV